MICFSWSSRCRWGFLHFGGLSLQGVERTALQVDSQGRYADDYDIENALKVT